MNPDGSHQEGVYISDLPLIGDFAIDDINRYLFVMRVRTKILVSMRY